MAAKFAADTFEAHETVEAVMGTTARSRRAGTFETAETAPPRVTDASIEALRTFDDVETFATIAVETVISPDVVVFAAAAPMNVTESLIRPLVSLDTDRLPETGTVEYREEAVAETACEIASTKRVRRRFVFAEAVELTDTEPLIGTSDQSVVVTTFATGYVMPRNGAVAQRVAAVFVVAAIDPLSGMLP